MKRLLIPLVFLAACTVTRAPASPAVERAATASPFFQRAIHHTETIVTDITDPMHPREVARTENTIGACGITNLIATLTGATQMPVASGIPESLGGYCSRSNNTEGVARVPCKFDSTARIAISAAGETSCSSANTPWKCCTGIGTGCDTVATTDVITFAEGQPNSTVAGANANYLSWVAASKPNAPAFLTVSSASLYWNGANIEGVQYSATADGSTANGNWCEYAVRSAAGSGCSIASPTGPTRAGWQLNHGLFSPCLTKPSGATFLITVTITFV